MFSWEIDQLLRKNQFIITSDEYAELRPQKNPQIERMTYNTATNRFYIKTNDGYEWEFEVKRN